MKHLRWRTLCSHDEACHVAYAGRSAGSRWNRHTQDFYEVFRVDSGVGRHWCNGKEVSLVSGEVVFVRPCDQHGFSATPSSEPFAIVNVAFPREAWRQLFSRYVWKDHGFFDEDAPLPPTAKPPPPAAEQISQLFRTALFGRRDAQTRDWFLLGLALILADPSSHRAYSGIPAWLRGALIEFEQDEETLPMGPRELARRAGCSPAHLARAMRATLGQPPSAWILCRRMERARRLLEATGYSIAEVALMSGFENLGNFHRHFRKLHGTTPAVFRREHCRVIR